MSALLAAPLTGIGAAGPAQAATVDTNAWYVLSRSASTAAAARCRRRFQWSSSGVLAGPKPDAQHPDVVAIKDFSVVRHNNQWLTLATTARPSGWSLVQFNFDDWSQAASAPHTYLDTSPMGPGYRAAPRRPALVVRATPPHVRGAADRQGQLGRRHLDRLLGHLRHHQLPPVLQ
ncbi:hypothetical protein AB0I98_41445 [Streptomyces sp. NPDC050211]|uniref:hypothetical protein n=1 Tax=Streptomyces sp. NPDC050211 TaxID=3154932 RepID=UPI003436AF23